jgi:hypothetical protein
MVINNDSILNNNKVKIIQDCVLLKESFALPFERLNKRFIKTLIMLYTNVLLSATNSGHDEMDRSLRATNIMYISAHNGREIKCGKPSEINL